MSENKVRFYEKKVSDLGKRAFFITFLLLFLTIFSPLNSLFRWLDLKITDLFFAARINSTSQEINHPAVVIVKDQTFFSRFSREPQRKDFALLLETLKNGGATVAALDFIYEQATNAENDQPFIDALKNFPAPVVAEHFVVRGTQTFERVNFADHNFLRPPWPNPIFSEVDRRVVSKGLINIYPELDSTVRFTPIGFHPTEQKEFRPSLGYATYIAWLFYQMENQFPRNNFDIDSQNPDGAIINFIRNGPHIFRTTGHSGVDEMTRRLEVKLVARILARSQPQHELSLRKSAEEINLEKLSANTWLQMPKEPLPIIEDHEMPSLRLNFRKSLPPIKSDGIESIPMSLLLPTNADEKYARSLFKTDLRIDNSSVSRLPVEFTWSKPGDSTVKGKIVELNGSPIAGVDVRLEMNDSTYWTTSKSDNDGSFNLSNIPAGRFTVSALLRQDHGWLKSSFTGETENNKLTELPVLYLVARECKVSLPEKGGSEKESLCLFGEAMHLVHTSQDGKLPENVPLPEGFNVTPLDDDIEVAGFTDGILFGKDNKPISDKQVAILCEHEDWNQKFFYKFPANTQELTLPSSLDCQIAIFSEDRGANEQKTTSTTLFPYQNNLIEKKLLPEPTRQSSGKRSLTLTGNEIPDELIVFSETEKVFKPNLNEACLIDPGNYQIIARKGELRGRFNKLKSILKNRTVFIGTALQEDQDFIVTPINFLDSDFKNIAGVHLHANLFSGLARNDFLKPLFFHADRAKKLWPTLQILFVLPLLFLCNWAFSRFGAMWGGLCVFFCGGIWLVAGLILFFHSLLLPTFFPVLNIFSFGVFRGYFAWVISRRQEKETRSTFGRFISAAIVEEIMKTPDSLKPGGEKKEISVMFTDLAGFTTISEKLEPEQLTELMNEYLGEMTSLLFKYGGTLDKYIGDAIMAFWNHPKGQPNHPEMAAECAIAMQKKLAELRQKWLSQGLPEVQVRAGINTATCMVGFIGSSIQMNFTCLGDGVNLASRLEGANKSYHTLMMIAESVYLRLDRKKFSTRFLDYLAVKGKDQPIKVYELRGFLAEESSAWLKVESQYHQGIEKYLARDWQAATKLFQSVLEMVPDDSPSKIFTERCAHFSHHPPPENWDGRYILKTK